VPEACSEASQTVFGPHRLHLLIRRKFASGGSSLGCGDSGLLFGRQWHRLFIVHASQPENNMSNLVLLVRRKLARGCERLIEKSCHWCLLLAGKLIVLPFGAGAVGKESLETD
jgi:hypothetical protein